MAKQLSFSSLHTHTHIYIYIYIYTYMLWQVKSSTIFWQREAQFGSSGCFCRGHEQDEPWWTVRCFSSPDTLQVLLTRFTSMARKTAPEYTVLGRPVLTLIANLTTPTEFLQPSSYWSLIKCACTSQTKNYFCPIRQRGS